MALHGNETAFPADRELLCFRLSTTHLRVRPSGARGVGGKGAPGLSCVQKAKGIAGACYKEKAFPSTWEMRAEMRGAGWLGEGVCRRGEAALGTARVAPVKPSRDIPVKRCARH